MYRNNSLALTFISQSSASFTTYLWHCKQPLLGRLEGAVVPVFARASRAASGAETFAAFGKTNRIGVLFNVDLCMPPNATNNLQDYYLSSQFENRELRRRGVFFGADAGTCALAAASTMK